MELYLDSLKFEEIREANKLGFLTGLTITPTFLHREGIKNIDSTIVELSKMVNILHVEALGATSEIVVKEAERILDLGLDKEKTVFKTPISLEGARACNMLRNKGINVNLHLVYTLQQAYMGFCAGATYVCLLVGRLQDQGHDALKLVEQCVNTVEKYNYPTKIMFSSVRNIEHVKDALSLGVHACTMPWSIMKQLPNNHFTDLGIRQFTEHTELLTLKASDLVLTDNVFLNYNSSVLDGLILMTESKTGAIIVLNDNGDIHRIFTDGDLRRSIKANGSDLLHKRFSEITPNTPVSVEVGSSLTEIINTFKNKEVDNLVVTDNNKPVGLIDIQDLIKWI
jgi:transaldolase